MGDPGHLRLECGLLRNSLKSLLGDHRRSSADHRDEDHSVQLRLRLDDARRTVQDAQLPLRDRKSVV